MIAIDKLFFPPCIVKYVDTLFSLGYNYEMREERGRVKMGYFKMDSGAHLSALLQIAVYDLSSYDIISSTVHNAPWL